MDDSQDLENEEFCYICFEGATRGPSGEVEPLVQVCRCPTRVHRRCVARWQLYSAGRREEKSCRFCQDTLPDWKEVLTPRSLPPAVPVLSIYYNNTCCRMKVRPGPDGLQAFLRQLQAIVGRDVANVNFVFRCRCPDTGAEIFLQGLQAFEAAMHCACVRAAQRSLLQQQQQQQQALLLQEQQQQQQQQALLLQQQQQQRERQQRERQQQGSQVLLQHHHQQNQQLLPQQMRPATGAHYLPYTSLTAAAAAAAAQGPQLRRASAPNERMFDAVPTHIGPSSAVLGSTAAAAAVAATRPPALDLLGSPFDSPPQLAGSMNRSSPPYILDGGGRDAATTGLAAASQCAGPSEGCSGAFIAASVASADATACAAAVGPAAAAAATLDLSPPPPPASQFSPPSSPQTTTTTPQSRTPPTPQSPPPPPPPGHWHPHLPGSTSQLTAAAPRALYGSIPPLLLGGGGTVVRPDVATAGNSSSRTTSSRAASLTIASTETAKLTEAAAVAPQAAAAAVCAASAPEPLMRHVSPDVSPPPPAPLPLPPLGSFGGRADGGLAPAAASAGPHRSAASQPAATSGAASSSPSPFPSPPSSSSSLAASARASGQPPLLRETAGSQPWPSRAGVGRCLGRGGGGGGDVGRTGGEKTRAAVLLSRKVDSVLAAVKSFKSALARKFAPRRVAG